MISGTSKFFALAALCVSLCAQTAFARNLTYEEKKSDFNQLLTRIQSGYGPLHFKESKIKLNLESLERRYLKKIKETETNSEFYYLIVKFVAEFQDSHFGARVPTTHRATLPFSTDLVQGKILVDAVREGVQLPFSRGDEVVSIDGLSAKKFLNQTEKYISAGSDENRRRVAAFLTTVRPGGLMPVPMGKAKLQVRRGTSNIIEDVELDWEHTGEPLDEFLEPKNSQLSHILRSRNYDMIVLPEYSRKPQHPAVERSFMCSGTTRWAIPKDATMIMEKPFVAYYYPTAKGNIGYLRIPHYSPVNDVTGAEEYELRFKQYENAVSVLEKNTVGLIIDQDHNCGGSVSYLERLVGLFMQQPFAPMKFQFIASKEEYLSFKEWLDSAAEYKNTLEYQELLAVAELIKKHWLAGDFLTPKTSFRFETMIAPNPVSYTKPIVMTIDEMSGSGGDAFPSMLQGYGRATLVGTATMGAGGHVTEEPPLFYSGIKVNMTKSLFFRPDGTPVENNGAVPDVPYEITRDDFVYQYRDYQKFVEKVLLQKL